jgi:hypothetical protein
MILINRNYLIVLLVLLGAVQSFANPQEASEQDKRLKGTESSTPPTVNPTDAGNQAISRSPDEGNPKSSTGSSGRIEIFGNSSRKTEQGLTRAIAQQDFRSELRLFSDEIKADIGSSLNLLRSSVHKLDEKLSSISFLLTILFLALAVQVFRGVWAFIDKYRRRHRQDVTIHDLSDQIDNLGDQLFKQFGAKHPGASAQRDIEAKLKAKEIEVEAKRKEIEVMKKAMVQSEDLIRNFEHKSASSDSELSNLRKEHLVLKAELDRVAADLGAIRAESSGLRQKLDAFKASLVPSLPGGVGSGLGNELAESLQQKSLHAVSLLGCLGMIKAAEGSAMEEEVLLSTLRQFSESLVSFRIEQGKLPDSVQKELVTWADAFNAQFNGRLDIRVPALGFPVDARTMIPLRGATKVSAVHSWCIYNSKGSVFAPAKVS